ncbi:MAG: A24 family peptidase [Bryobacteraceae bacterium]
MIFAVLGIATGWDLSSRRIPNWLVLPFIVGGISLAGFQFGLHGIWTSLGGVGVAILMIGPFCWLGGMGMGDLKLCAGIGSWLGPGPVFFALIMTAIAGGLLAVCYAFWHRSLGRSLAGTGDIISELFHGNFRRDGERPLRNPAALSIPYAPAITIGTIFAFLASRS